jgi:hypothetical protein
MVVRLISLCIVFISFDAAASDAATASAVRYYAAGLEQPLLLLRSGSRLIAACTGRLRSACSKAQRQLAASDRTIALLDSLTLFPQRPDEDPAAGVRTADELRRRIAATSAELLAAASRYDLALFARFGATLRACPDPDIDADRYRASLDELIRLDLTGFQSLAADDIARARESIAAEELSAAATLGAVPSDHCAAANRLGIHLMELMHSKLQPWSGEDRRVANQEPTFDFGAPAKPKTAEPPANEMANAIAGNFVSVVATELELTAYPENGARIGTIVDQ